ELPMIQIRQLKKEYGTHCILDIDTLDVDKGLYWLKGANGSGKSTFLKILGGIIPFKGEVFIDGISVKKETTEYRKLVSYAEAEPLFPSFLTGKDLIAFFNHTRKANATQTTALIEAFNIASYIGNPICTYSSGMVKKLSLVLAFIGDVPLMLLDEPLVTLDKESIGVLYDLVTARAQQGAQFVFTSHQAFELNAPNIQTLEVKDHAVWVP
ncbi:MAG: ATP-binding cassette domain-containing protein, partial [Flammeovirgaceae bacterium]